MSTKDGLEQIDSGEAIAAAAHEAVEGLEPGDSRRGFLKKAGLAATDDLYQAGMSSHASVNVMLALEGEFDVEFPDHLLKRSVFESIASIRSAIDDLTA